MQTKKMIEQVINGMTDKIEMLEDKLEAVNKVNDDRITAVKSMLVDDYEGKIETLENDRIETLENGIKALYKLDRSNENAIIKVNNKYDDLESKYFKLLQAIDELRKDGESKEHQEIREKAETEKILDEAEYLADKYEAEEKKYRVYQTISIFVNAKNETEAIEKVRNDDATYQGWNKWEVECDNNINLTKNDINKLVNEVVETKFNDDGTIKEDNINLI